jgi:hypothetical protein
MEIKGFKEVCLRMRYKYNTSTIHPPTRTRIHIYPALRQYEFPQLLREIQGYTDEIQVEIPQYWGKSIAHSPMLATVDLNNRYTTGRYEITQLWIKSFCVFGKGAKVYIIYQYRLL